MADETKDDGSGCIQFVFAIIAAMAMSYVVISMHERIVKLESAVFQIEKTKD